MSCPGIPSKALDGVNRELRARRVSEDEARREAENWWQKYEALQAAMASAGLSQALTQKALTYLDEGDFVNAAATFDEALKGKDREVTEVANTHYYKAKVAVLAFDSKTAMDQLATAYRLAPDTPDIAADYANLLARFGRSSEAANGQQLDSV